MSATKSEKKSYASKSSIFLASDLKIHEEPVPEWPDADGNPTIMRLKQMDVDTNIRMTKELEVPGCQDDGILIILILSAVDENDNPMFTMNDKPALRKKSMKVLNRLQNICLKMNRMRDEDKEALKKG
jgi:hypothetical protein